MFHSSKQNHQQMRFNIRSFKQRPAKWLTGLMSVNRLPSQKTDSISEESKALFFLFPHLQCWRTYLLVKCLVSCVPWGNFTCLKQALSASVAVTYYALFYKFYKLNALSVTRVLQKDNYIGGPFIYGVEALAFSSFLHNIISLFFTFLKGKLGFYSKVLVRSLECEY